MSESIVDKLYAALEAVEWGGIEMACPDCCWDKSERGHSPDCNLAAALAETDEIRKRWDQQLCRDIATGE